MNKLKSFFGGAENEPMTENKTNENKSVEETAMNEETNKKDNESTAVMKIRNNRTKPK